MLKYILKRLALMLFTFFIIMTICFVLVKLLPLTPATQFGKDAELILARRKALGYDKPIIIQYFIFLNRSLIHGDWGISEKLYFGQDVWDIFVSKLPATIMVNTYSLIFSIPLGLILGIYAALKKINGRIPLFLRESCSLFPYLRMSTPFSYNIFFVSNCNGSI